MYYSVGNLILKPSVGQGVKELKKYEDWTSELIYQLCSGFLTKREIPI